MSKIKKDYYLHLKIIKQCEIDSADLEFVEPYVNYLENKAKDLLNILESISEERIFCFDSMDRNTGLEQQVKEHLDKYKEC